MGDAEPPEQHAAENEYGGSVALDEIARLRRRITEHEAAHRRWGELVQRCQAEIALLRTPLAVRVVEAARGAMNGSVDPNDGPNVTLIRRDRANELRRRLAEYDGARAESGPA